MIGRQLGILPSHPPNWIVTEPSGAFFAVMWLLKVGASSRPTSLQGEGGYQKRSSGHLGCGQTAPQIAREKTAATTSARLAPE
jgi:hypothetical protein